ncbi:MAG: hypothetical protein EBR82_21510 [Caulobacteraceae bacterium]|nr:hypothetical protein [Caulobacteraceae bacterium]
MRIFNLFGLSILTIVLFGCGPKLEPLPPAVNCTDATQARETLAKAGYDVVPVLGTGSMAPWIPAHPLGRKIVVAYAGLSKVPYAHLKSGNVVIYSRYGQKIIHRLGEQDERGFLAFGIHNSDKDRNEDGGIGFVTPYSYIGRVEIVTLFPL